MKKLLITSLFLGSCVLLLAQKTTKIPNVYKPVRSEMYKKGWIDFNKNGVKDTYEDPTAPIDARIEDLLSQMTLEEKTCQMVTLYGYKRVLKDDLPTSEWKNQLWKDGIGAIDEHLNGFQQWGLPPSDNEYVWPASKHAWALNEVQRFFIEETRLGIPTDFTNEGIRGVESYKATNFPTQLGLGHTWNRQLIHQVGLITGREARMLGYTNVYAPILDVGRDQRWGRYEEVYGESPYLVAELGIEMVRGMQHNHQVAATGKHFIAYSNNKGAREGMARVDPQMSPREVDSDYMYKYIENDFFAPEFAVKSLAIHELRGWPSLMEGKVNRCHDRFGWWGDEETIRRAYQDRSVLKNATDSETYDLTPTWENYYRLTDADKGLGLTRSPYNYDRMTLLYIVDKGYPRDGVVDEYPDEFSFHEKFEKIESKQLGRNRWDVYDEMQERAKKLAGKLLKEHFPEIRQKADMKEKAAVRKSKGMKM